MYAPQIAHYAPTMVQAINNPDGTVSIIQMDPNSHAVVTLPDGTQAQVRALSAVRVSPLDGSSPSLPPPVSMSALRRCLNSNLHTYCRTAHSRRIQMC